VSASGLATTGVVTAREILVVCGAGTEVCAVTLGTSAADVSPVQGIDPDSGFHLVRVECDAAAGTQLAADAWDAAVSLGQRALAHQNAGASRAMLDLAREHALGRVQFGRPIARFQAVRHRLAEALVAIEALEATLAAAGDQPNPVTAALAKAVAGRTARTVGAHCQQVLAGIGFTTDHPFHRFLKRTIALEGIFGSADEITMDLGRQLLAGRRVPTLIEL
jgi:alkylation response protein AidB-like acyl-CoA dehydrogenase